MCLGWWHENRRWIQGTFRGRVVGVEERKFEEESNIWSLGKWETGMPSDQCQGIYLWAGLWVTWLDHWEVQNEEVANGSFSIKNIHLSNKWNSFWNYLIFSPWADFMKIFLEYLPQPQQISRGSCCITCIFKHELKGNKNLNIFGGGVFFKILVILL